MGKWYTIRAEGHHCGQVKDFDEITVQLRSPSSTLYLRSVGHKGGEGLGTVLSGINAAVLFTVTLDESGVEHVTVTVDLEGLLPAGAGTQDVSDYMDTDYAETDYKESEPPQKDNVNRIQRTPKLVSLFNTDTYFVGGDEAYCTDVLGTAKISHGLALGGISENPEGRTDTFLTNRERDQGNLIIVGGPAVNPAAVEFGGYFGISYKEKSRVSFTKLTQQL